MVWLYLFGGAQVEKDAGPFTGRAAHKRRLALLALLAASAPRSVTRDRLIALLWPESDTERARHLLSESLYVLRKELSENIFIAAGDSLALNPGVITCDVVDFETGIATGDLARAVDVYRGPFLDGFFVSGAPEFERWVDGERERLARLYTSVMERLAGDREARGDAVGAVVWWRRLADHDPYNSRIAIRLMQALEVTGARVEAIRFAGTHSALLREDLGVEADPDVEVFAQRLRAAPTPNGVHARWAAPADTFKPDSALPIDDSAAVIRARVAEPDREPSVGDSLRSAAVQALPLRSRRSSLYIGFVVSFLILTLTALYLRPESTTVSATESVDADPARVAVLYFDDHSPGGDLSYLADGITESVIHELSQIDALEVVSENGVRPYRGSTTSPDSIVRQLEVGTLVSGSVARSGDRLRVSVRLTEAGTGTTLRSEVLERPWGELFALMDDVVTRVSESLRQELGHSIQLKGWQARTSSQEAWTFVQHAATLRQSARQLYGIGNVDDAVTTLEHADSLLMQAERLDPRWSDPVVLRGWIAHDRGFISFAPPARNAAETRRWFEVSLGHANRALSIDPANPLALELRGSVRHRMGAFDPPADAVSAAELQRIAEQDLRAAVAADPMRTRAWSDLSAILLDQGRFFEAQHAAKRAYDNDPFVADAHQILDRLFQTAFELGQDEEAATWCDQIRVRFQQGMAYVHCSLVLAAWSPAEPDPDEAWRIVDQSTRYEAPEISAVLRPRKEILVAGVLARAGLADSARAVLQRAKAGVGMDPDLLQLAAGVHALLGERDEVRQLLNAYIAPMPLQRWSVLLSRRFHSLRGSPELESLLARYVRRQPPQEGQ